MAAYSKEQMAQARDGLCLADDLKRSEARVGMYLLKRINQTTGQCNPSIETIAEDLEYSRSTVIRALNGLEKNGYFEKKLFGSRTGTNQYYPCWDKFTGVSTVTEKKMFGSKRRNTDVVTVAAETPEGSQECDLGGGKGETQTLKNNPKKTLLKPDADSSAENTDSGASKDNCSTNSRPRNSSSAKYSTASIEPRRRTLSRRDIALEKAKKRIDDEIRKNHKDFYIHHYVYLPQETLAKAYEMEVGNKGSGAPYLLSIKTHDM